MDCSKYTVSFIQGFQSLWEKFLERFIVDFKDKTLRGRQEHGDQVIWLIDGISEAKDEILDLWAYVSVEEEKKELTRTEVIWLRKFFGMFESELSLMGYSQEMHEVEHALYTLERYFGLETQQYDLELEDGEPDF